MNDHRTQSECFRNGIQTLHHTLQLKRFLCTGNSIFKIYESGMNHTRSIL